MDPETVNVTRRLPLAAVVLLASMLAACSATGATPPAPGGETPASPAPVPVPPPPPLEEDAVVCPADVKLCPDGSWVVRNPARRCEFDPCPGER
jgi:hypothetical protein